MVVPREPSGDALGTAWFGRSATKKHGLADADIAPIRVRPNDHHVDTVVGELLRACPRVQFLSRQVIALDRIDRPSTARVIPQRHVARITMDAEFHPARLTVMRRRGRSTE